MRFDKLKYKALVKSKEQASVHQFSDSLNDALMSKDVSFLEHLQIQIWYK